jgi:UDP-N-acetylglucosamine 4,6-dehydratase/5-epimerase
MTRFFMFLEDAIDLVKYAANNGKNGDILIKKAPSAKIIDVAKLLYKLLNKKENIQLIGVRHGEKIHETLVSTSEMMKAKNLGNFFKIPLDTRDLNYKAYFAKGKKLNKVYDEYSSSQNNISQEQLNRILKRLI